MQIVNISYLSLEMVVIKDDARGFSNEMPLVFQCRNCMSRELTGFRHGQDRRGFSRTEGGAQKNKNKIKIRTKLFAPMVGG